MNDGPSTRAGFFSRHPRVTMNLVTLTILAGSVSWIVTALRSGKGAHGHTIDGSPTMFWIEIFVMGLIAVFAMIFAFRVGIKTVRWSTKSPRF